MDTGELIRKARYEAALSQGELARRVGIGQSTLSALECGSRTPSLGMLRKVLAGAGKELSLSLVPAKDHVQRQAKRIEVLPVGRRPAVLNWAGLHLIDELPHRVVGKTAAAVLGAPIEISRLDIAVADDERTFGWLSRIMDRFIGRLRAPGWTSFRNVQIGPDQMRELIRTECPDGEFEVATFHIPARVRVRPSDEVARHILVESEHGAIPVQPVHEIDDTDPSAARLLRLLRNG